MKKTILLMGFLVMALGSLSAMARPPVTESFRQTCSVVSENRNRIEAHCRTVRGDWLYNNFDRRGCVSDIANIDGRLTCDRQGNGLPPGSYRQTCYDCQVFGNDNLSCSCRTMRGDYLRTSLNYGYCRSEIANIDGYLRCN